MHGRARGSCDPPTVVAMFPFLRPVRFSKRTASPALTAAVLAESPLANSVSEREANDQADSNFQHSDSAEAETRTPPDQGGVPGTPWLQSRYMRAPLRATRGVRQRSCSCQGARSRLKCLIRTLRSKRGSMLCAPIPDALRSNSLTRADNTIDGMTLKQLRAGIF
jgi:hypothetical protein